MTGSIGFISASEDGLEGIVVVVLYADCDVNDESEGGLEIDSELSEASDIVRDESDRLGGRDEDCCEAADDRLLEEGLSITGETC